MIRVVLADDQELVRAGFRALLDGEADITVVGEAADGAAAVAVVRATRPDVVLMDIRMPGLDGLTATRQLLEETDETKVVILTTFELDEYVFESLYAPRKALRGRSRRRQSLALLHSHRIRDKSVGRPGAKPAGLSCRPRSKGRAALRCAALKARRDR